MKQSHKTILLWMMLILMFISIWHFSTSSSKKKDIIDFSEFLQYLADDRVKEITIKGDTSITGRLIEKDKFRDFKTIGKVGDDLQAQLAAKKVIFRFEERDEGVWQSVLITWLPMLFLFFIFFFFMRQIQAGGGKAMSFGKSKARLLSDSHKRVTFQDVAGIDEAKEELQEIIEFLKDPKRFTRLGGRIPKGVLLMGPPGTGKTLLARGVAGEAEVPFFSISGSDFVEMFVGVGAARVRDLFEQGKKNAPCIIFIDEIDAVGRHRGAGLGGGHDEREQTLNQLLVEMDGFESNDGVILISATNRPDVLDPALLRPGRFDRRVVVHLPDIKGREEILQVHTRKTPVDESVDLSVIARGSPGFSGADLENLVNEAALLAASESKSTIDMEDFEMAKDKVLMGTEMKSRVISEKEKRVTAYHEAGHALVGVLLPHTDPVHKVTIIPRGRALGLTMQLPTEDRLSVSLDFANDQIAFALGGRIAEEIVFNQKTTGAGNDLEKATNLARKMVCEWGMSDKLGPLTFGKVEEQIFLGKEIARHQEYSEQTAVEIDREVRRVVMDNYNRAREIIDGNLDKLKLLAEALLEKESLDGDEVLAIIEGKEDLVEQLAARSLDENGDLFSEKQGVARESEGLAAYADSLLKKVGSFKDRLAKGEDPREDESS